MKLRPTMTAWMIPALFCLTATAQPAPETPPISVGIVLDTSGSMGHKLARARQLVRELLKLAGPHDEFALILASDRPVVASGYGTPADALETQLSFALSKGRSAILDGIYMGLEVSKAGRNQRKVLLVISDGGDNHSRYTEAEVRNAMMETGVRVFVIGFDEPAGGTAFLQQIAEHGGGGYSGIERGTNLPQIAQELIGAMRLGHAVAYSR